MPFFQQKVIEIEIQIRKNSFIPSMRSHIADYLRLMRIPVAAGIALPPVIGAISVSEYSITVLVPLFFIGILSGIYGFVLNDIFDVDLDKLSTDLLMRSLVKETVSIKAAKIIITLCFIIAYLTTFLFFYRNHILFYGGLTCLIIADVLGYIYNRYGKQILASDFLIALAESFFFLFGALMVLTNTSLGMFTWILFILFFIQVLYMNAVEGGLKDADHDYLMNVKNIALTLGVKITKNQKISIPRNFKLFGMGIRFLTAFLMFTPFIFFSANFQIWQIVLLIIIIILLLYSSAVMLNLKHFDRGNIRRIIGTQLFLWYAAVLTMLISIIGLYIALILCALPIIWYVFFSYLIGEKIILLKL